MMPELVEVLNDLGPALDAPHGAGLVARIEQQLRRPAGSARRRGWLRWRVGIAMMAALTAAAVVPASRSAIARWLGVGAVEIRIDATTPPGNNDASSPQQPVASSRIQERLGAVRSQVPFKVLVAGSSAGALTDVRLDRSVGDGVVVLSYPGFVLTEIASAPNVPPQLSKLVSPQDSVQSLQVNGHSGYWVTGPNHRVSFLDRKGRLVLDSVRRAGPTLLWESNGVTFRIEGIASQREAVEIATELQ